MGDTGDIDGIFLTTVVNHGHKVHLYSGYVTDFYFDKSGNLDRVILKDADRRSLSNDPAPSDDSDTDE